MDPIINQINQLVRQIEELKEQLEISDEIIDTIFEETDELLSEEVLSEEEYKKMRTFILFESSEVDLMQRDLNRLDNLSELDIEDIHIICYRAKTSYFQGISVLLSKIYVAGYKREALSVVADIIEVLKTQAHKVYSISNRAQNIAGELVFLSCFTNYSNWFESYEHIVTMLNDHGVKI
jgi:hypothetical protein